MSATKIIPRWEWRCFAPSLAALARKIDAPVGTNARESDETYILEHASGASDNIKIRDGVLDLKRLRQTDSAGLEQWEPVLKASFPLRRSDMAAVFGDQVLQRDSYTLDEFTNFVAHLPGFRAVTVHKSRRGFTFGGCISELARITVGTVALESFSLEHEDPKLVLASLRTLDLDGHANISYPMGLKRALGLAHVPA